MSTSAWKRNVLYDIGDEVIYNDVNYTCVVNHKSTKTNRPDKTDILWDATEVIPEPTPAPAPPTATGVRRGMWVWNASNVTSSFITECKRIKLTDVYLYLTVNQYGNTAWLRAIVKKFTDIGIKCWGLDGSRAYFNDSTGPAGLYKSINALIAYNGKVTSAEKFVGFQTDNEPDDYSGNYRDSFHNDVKTSALSKTSGGVWKANAYQDRMSLIDSWLTIQRECTRLLHAAGLQSGAALPTWTEDYYSEPLKATFNGTTKTVAEHFIDILDDVFLMSYRTDLTQVISRSTGELKFAQGKPCKVWVGLETHKGRGGAVTYGDHATKNSKTAVLSDIATLETKLSAYTSFGGVNIHDEVGWMALKA